MSSIFVNLAILLMLPVNANVQHRECNAPLIPVVATVGARSSGLCYACINSKDLFLKVLLSLCIPLLCQAAPCMQLVPLPDACGPGCCNLVGHYLPPVTYTSGCLSCLELLAELSSLLPWAYRLVNFNLTTGPAHEVEAAFAL